MLFNLSVAKIFVLLAVALVVLGPERLPALLHQFGKWLGELKKLRENFESEMRDVIGELPSISDLKPGALPGPLGNIDNPFAGLSESVSSIGDSLRSVLGTKSLNDRVNPASSQLGQANISNQGTSVSGAGQATDQQVGVDGAGQATDQQVGVDGAGQATDQQVNLSVSGTVEGSTTNESVIVKRAIDLEGGRTLSYDPSLN